MELVCPAGNLPSLKAAADNGADAVYLGFRNETNARHFAGLNFSTPQIEQGLDYARARNVRVYVAINTFPQPDTFATWERAVDQAGEKSRMDKPSREENKRRNKSTSWK